MNVKIYLRYLMSDNIHKSDLYAQPLEYWQSLLSSMTDHQLKNMNREICLEVIRRQLRYLDRDTLMKLHKMSNNMMKSRDIKKDTGE